MRSFFNRLGATSILRRTAVVLFMLGCMNQVSACHRNDMGSEFRQAAAKGDITKVQSLLKVDPNLVFTKNKVGATALHWAVAYGHKDVVEYLLANHAVVNAVTKQGSTPLHWAVGGGHNDVAELLLAHGADVNARDEYGNTPLQGAVSQNHKEVAELLNVTHNTVAAHRTHIWPPHLRSCFLADA